MSLVTLIPLKSPTVPVPVDTLVRVLQLLDHGPAREPREPLLPEDP